jgi:hypothetical protein
MSQFSEKMMKKAVPYLTMVTVLAVLSLCATSIAYSAAPTTYPTYPLKVTASPKSQSTAPGVIATVTLKQKNMGSSTFPVTACLLEIATSKTGPYSSVSCTLSAPYSIPPGKTVKTSFSFLVPSTPGTYYLKYWDVGTVSSTTYKSMVAEFSDTVT